MKKLIALLLTLAMLLSCTAIAETATDVTGLWYASMYGMVVTLEVKEDNTLSMGFMGETIDGVWEIENGVFYIDRGMEDETALTFAEDGTMVDETGTMFFGREPIAEIEMPTTVSATDVADFNGNWVATKIDAFGMKLDMEEAMAEGLGELLGAEDGAQLTASIDNGQVSVFGSEAEMFDFVDGKLQNVMEDEEMASLNQYVYLTEDGGIAYEVMTMLIYFSKAE